MCGSVCLVFVKLSEELCPDCDSDQSTLKSL